VPNGEVLEREVAARSESRSKAKEKREEQAEHDGTRFDEDDGNINASRGIE
jgi:hypothetical protein